MYLGKIVEVGSRKQLYESPMHPYTQALSLRSQSSPRTSEASGHASCSRVMPSPANPPSGCRFRIALLEGTGDLCRGRARAHTARRRAHPVACHFAEIMKLLELAERTFVQQPAG
jgi:oligopeptide/dipeptide ABC transporter ATP-binding protein